jgi:hypothetical protein
MYSRAEMESCVSWVEDDEGADDEASEADAEADSAIAQSILQSSTTNGTGEAERDWQYSHPG